MEKDPKEPKKPRVRAKKKGTEGLESLRRKSIVKNPPGKAEALRDPAAARAEAEFQREVDAEHSTTTGSGDTVPTVDGGENVPPPGAAGMGVPESAGGGAPPTEASGPNWSAHPGSPVEVPPPAAGVSGLTGMRRMVGSRQKMLGGVAAGAGLGIAGLMGLGALRQPGVDDRERLGRDLRAQARDDAISMMHLQETRAHQQRSITENLERLRMGAPDVYARVASGMDVPDGATVIGGTPRVDLLQRLGTLMADGKL